MAARAHVLVGLFCVVAVACERSDPPPKPNLILVSIDSLRADRVGAYGAERDTSPAIDRLAAEGGLFETVMAPTSWTLPSHVTLLTGLSVPVHGVAEPRDRLDDRRTTLAQHLSANGYRTAGFVSAPFLHRAYGFARGFERYANFGVTDGSVSAPDNLQIVGSHGDQTAQQVIDAAIAWLTETPSDDDAPFFLFVHLWDPHYDYIPPPPYATLFDPDYEGDLEVRNYELNRAIDADIPARDLQHLRALYDGEIRWTDSQLDRLLGALEGRGGVEGTIVSLTADHGEEFFEHGKKGHRKTLFEESVRVPWIVRFPGRVSPGTRIGGVASLEDVAPTLLDLMGVAPLPEATGRSLAGFLTGQMEGAPETPVLLNHVRWTAMRGSNWKLLVDVNGRAARMYDLDSDPRELRPLTGARVDAGRLRALERRMARDSEIHRGMQWGEPAEVDIDGATRERLRELGYIE
jgi:arylsulfatase A-like enzyme